METGPSPSGSYHLMLWTSVPTCYTHLSLSIKTFGSSGAQRRCLQVDLDSIQHSKEPRCTFESFCQLSSSVQEEKMCLLGNNVYDVPLDTLECMTLEYPLLLIRLYGQSVSSATDERRFNTPITEFHLALDGTSRNHEVRRPISSSSSSSSSSVSPLPKRRASIERVDQHEVRPSLVSTRYETVPERPHAAAFLVWTSSTPIHTLPSLSEMQESNLARLLRDLETLEQETSERVHRLMRVSHKNIFLHYSARFDHLERVPYYGWTLPGDLIMSLQVPHETSSTSFDATAFWEHQYRLALLRNPSVSKEEKATNDPRSDVELWQEMILWCARSLPYAADYIHLCGTDQDTMRSSLAFTNSGTLPKHAHPRDDLKSWIRHHRIDTNLVEFFLGAMGSIHSIHDADDCETLTILSYLLHRHFVEQARFTSGSILERIQKVAARYMPLFVSGSVHRNVQKPFTYSMSKDTQRQLNHLHEEAPLHYAPQLIPHVFMIFVEPATWRRWKGTDKEGTDKKNKDRQSPYPPVVVAESTEYVAAQQDVSVIQSSSSLCKWNQMGSNKHARSFRSQLESHYPRYTWYKYKYRASNHDAYVTASTLVDPVHGVSYEITTIPGSDLDKGYLKGGRISDMLHASSSIQVIPYPADSAHERLLKIHPPTNEFPCEVQDTNLTWSTSKDSTSSRLGGGTIQTLAIRAEDWEKDHVSFAAWCNKHRYRFDHVEYQVWKGFRQVLIHVHV